VLCENLEAGALIRRTGEFRKLRYALEGRGKSSGARVIYFPDTRCQRVYMVIVYAKAEKHTLSTTEENELRRLAAELKGMGC